VTLARVQALEGAIKKQNTDLQEKLKAAEVRAVAMCAHNAHVTHTQAKASELDGKLKTATTTGAASNKSEQGV
jgi:hypothetical protein